MVRKRTASLRKPSGRIRQILSCLDESYPAARCTLTHSNSLELLIATMLSAQCTDERVNFVTRDLFRKYRTAKDYVHVRREDFEKDIQSTGFYRNKAKSIQRASGASRRRSKNGQRGSWRCIWQSRRHRSGHSCLQSIPAIGISDFRNRGKGRTRFDADHSPKPMDIFFPSGNSAWPENLQSAETLLL
jgi:hypothetical protein